MVCAVMTWHLVCSTAAAWCRSADSGPSMDAEQWCLAVWLCGWQLCRCAWRFEASGPLNVPRHHRAASAGVGSLRSLFASTIHYTCSPPLRSPARTTCRNQPRARGRTESPFSLHGPEYRSTWALTLPGLRPLAARSRIATAAVSCRHTQMTPSQRRHLGLYLCSCKHWVKARPLRSTSTSPRFITRHMPQ